MVYKSSLIGSLWIECVLTQLIENIKAKLSFRSVNLVKRLTNKAKSTVLLYSSLGSNRSIRDAMC